MNRLTAMIDNDKEMVLQELEIVKNKYEKLLEEHKKLQEFCNKRKTYKVKYSQTEKGKLAQQRASKKYWEKKRSGNPRGRPKKNVSINENPEIIKED